MRILIHRGGRGVSDPITAISWEGKLFCTFPIEWCVESVQKGLERAVKGNNVDNFIGEWLVISYYHKRDGANV
jgi:hypothetical protein